MAKNLIPEIVKMLGVEIKEEFKLSTNDALYMFDGRALCVKDCSGLWKCNNLTAQELSDLLHGQCEIIKLPWKPKVGEIYYSFTCTYGKWDISRFLWSKHPYDYALLEKGWVYRTREEAEAALPKVAEELGVEYEI